MVMTWVVDWGTSGKREVASSREPDPRPVELRETTIQAKLKRVQVKSQVFDLRDAGLSLSPERKTRCCLQLLAVLWVGSQHHTRRVDVW